VPLRIAVLVKQVPSVESMELGPDGRLRREGVALEMNAYCRRAVAKAVSLVREQGGEVVAITLAPPSGEEVLREAVAWGADRGVLVSDPAFAGSDTLATAKALAATLRLLGPFDLVLAGRNSVDADTGQVPPEVAELLDLPFVAAARELEVQGGHLEARSELDDGWRVVRTALPAVVSTAERLCDPCKVDEAGRRAVDPVAIARLRADDLGPGPWGATASPTRVGPVRVLEVMRARVRLDGDPLDQARRAVALLEDRGVLGEQRVPHQVPDDGDRPAAPAPDGPLARSAGRLDGDGRRARDAEPRTDKAELAGRRDGGPTIGVLMEPDRPRVGEELIVEAHRIGATVGGRVVALVPLGERSDAALLEAIRGGVASLLAELVAIEGSVVEEDVACGVLEWASASEPWALLAPGTLFGREVASRVAARLEAGLTGDAVGFEVEGGRLVCLKPAFGGRLVAAITASSQLQLATVRPGVLGRRRVPGDRTGSAELDFPTVASSGHAEQRSRLRRVTVAPRGRIEVLEAGRDDDVEQLLAASRVVGVGAGVAPEEYGALEPLRVLLGAELAASRKVTDRGWMPRARQVGLTGHSLSCELYVAVGVQGKFNHMVATRAVHTVVALNVDPQAPVFDWADVGLVGDWRELVRCLVAVLEERVTTRAQGASIASAGS
jgi:electron transfer flavoprotein alpha subunit